jgi:hypothetical protein
MIDRTFREKVRRQKSKNSFTRHTLKTNDLLPSLTHDTIFNEFVFAVNLSNGSIVNNKRAFPFRAYI